MSSSCWKCTVLACQKCTTWNVGSKSEVVVDVVVVFKNAWNTGTRCHSLVVAFWEQDKPSFVQILQPSFHCAVLLSIPSAHKDFFSLALSRMTSEHWFYHHFLTAVWQSCALLLEPFSLYFSSISWCVQDTEFDNFPVFFHVN